MSYRFANLSPCASLSILLDSDYTIVCFLTLSSRRQPPFLVQAWRATKLEPICTTCQLKSTQIPLNYCNWVALLSPVSKIVPCLPQKCHRGETDIKADYFSQKRSKTNLVEKPGLWPKCISLNRDRQPASGENSLASAHRDHETRTSTDYDSNFKRFLENHFEKILFGKVQCKSRTTWNECLAVRWNILQIQFHY